MTTNKLKKMHSDNMENIKRYEINIENGIAVELNQSRISGLMDDNSEITREIEKNEGMAIYSWEW